MRWRKGRQERERWGWGNKRELQAAYFWIVPFKGWAIYTINLNFWFRTMCKMIISWKWSQYNAHKRVLQVWVKCFELWQSCIPRCEYVHMSRLQVSSWLWRSNKFIGWIQKRWQCTLIWALGLCLLTRPGESMEQCADSAWLDTLCWLTTLTNATNKVKDKLKGPI